MEDAQSYSSANNSLFARSLSSKYHDLVDVPVSDQIRDNFSALFNYLDIYGPKIPLLHKVITFIRLFQLIGGAFMAANDSVFDKLSVSFHAISIFSVFFHIIPVQYRDGNEFIMLYVINTILLIFAVYLLVASFKYKKTSLISRFSTVILTIFMSFVPFLFIPIMVQYFGQIISSLFAKTYYPGIVLIASLVFSGFNFLIYSWTIVTCYTRTLTFRVISFQTIEGSSQCKLYFITNLITFFSSMTSYLDKAPSVVFVMLSAFCYVYNMTTVFNCANFVYPRDQTLVFGGSVLGFVLCIVSIYPILSVDEWPDWFIAVFGGIAFIIFLVADFFTKYRIRRHLNLLDEYEESANMDVFKSKNKFKEVVADGFRCCHSSCIDFSIFKAAVEKWSTELDIWSLYAKYISLYPEQTSTLMFIATNIKSLIKTNSLAEQRLANIGQIIKSRETKFTPELKSKISKITKLFNKTKSRIRNIWDLVLQGNINDLDHAIKNAYESVNASDIEIKQLMMLYPNNRYVARQYSKFMYEIKADLIGFKKSQDNVKLLQKGLSVNEDTLHELGFIAFPEMPENIETSISRRIDGPTEESFGQDEVMVEEDLDIQQTENLKGIIERHKIPAIKFMFWSTILVFLIFVMLPVIALTIWFGYYTSSLAEPLDFLYGISFMRNLINILPAFIGKYLVENIVDPKNTSRKLMATMEIPDNFPLTAYGGNKDTKKIVEYLTTQVPVTTSMLTAFRSYHTGNKYLEQARNKIFTNVLPFNFYLNSTDVRTTSTSMVQLIYMIATHCRKVLDFGYVDIDVAAGMDAVTSRSNDVTTTRVAGEAMNLIVDYIREWNTFNEKLYFFVMITCIVVALVAFALVYHFQVSYLKSNKQQIYGLLGSLPKMVISNISSSFSKIKKDNTESYSVTNSAGSTETTRQEESIIKLFSSISDGTSSGSVEVYNIFNLIIVAVCAIGCYVFLCTGFISASQTLVKSCHHINYLYGSICIIYSILSSILTILPSVYDESLKAMCPLPQAEIDVISGFLPTVVDYLHLLFIGGTTENDIPFLSMKKSLDAASDVLRCKNDTVPPTTVQYSAHCFSASGQLYLTIALLKRFNSQMQLGIWPELRGGGVDELWQIGPFELYEAFYYHTGEKLVPTITDTIKGGLGNMILCGTILTIVAFIFTIISLILIKREEKLLKFTLGNLLRCSPQTIFSNPHIIEVLSGNYSKKLDAQKEKTLLFHNDVVNKLDDVIIVVGDENSAILSVNTAFQEMFAIEQKDIENTKISDFFLNGKFKCDSKLEKVLVQTKTLIYNNEKGDKIYIEFSNQSVQGRRIFSGRNVTQMLMHEKMIADEKKKSDAMLASILPPMLVSRVQAGEKDISFAVQSVTVLFLDIVEFTPWCGSHDAQYVMGMLNILFKEFDAITNAHKTMTKIKCIGDCYMAAGGIFDEVNQPAVHAREVVDFGCSVIKKLVQIDEDNNETLRIRVGINTGGPVVAGVIGTEKPTFEILGPAINIAHEMEHHGVPMKVHISRPVYELIYGQQFDIKERGEIDVKGGKMFTYLVEP